MRLKETVAFTPKTSRTLSRHSAQSDISHIYQATVKVPSMISIFGLSSAVCEIIPKFCEVSSTKCTFLNIFVTSTNLFAQNYTNKGLEVVYEESTTKFAIGFKFS